MPEIIVYWWNVLPILLSAIAIASGAVALAQIPDGAGPEKVTVTGTVVNSVTGAPVSRALVRLQGTQRAVAPNVIPSTGNRAAVQGLGSLGRAVTDGSGRFSFEVEKPGYLTVYAVREGFQMDPKVGATPVPLKESSDVTVLLTPLSAISGHVVNEDGDPLQGLAVQLVHITVLEGRRELNSYASMVTDDQGFYRLWALPAGDYYLKVMGRAGITNGLADSVRFSQTQIAYGPVYYPTGPDLKSAQVLKLGPGQDLRADFTLQGRPAFQISGRIESATRRPLSIRLLRDGDALANRGSVNLATGAFQVVDVTPGTYTVQAWYVDADKTLWLAESNATVGNSDVTGLILPLSSGVNVRGRVIRGGPPEQDDSLSVHATILDPRRMPVQGMIKPAGVADDGQFTLEGLLPGRYQIEVFGLFGSYVANITSGPADVLADDLEVGTGSSPELEVRIQPGGGALGVEVDGPGSKIGARVTLFRRHGSSLVLQENAYLGASAIFPSLAPGEYVIYAIPPGKDLEYLNPAAMIPFSSFATNITIREGDEQVVKVKMIPPEAIP